MKTSAKAIVTQVLVPTGSPRSFEIQLKSTGVFDIEKIKKLINKIVEVDFKTTKDNL